MAKTNINFNNTTYAIDESELAPAIDELQTHLSTVINGSGAVINVGDIDYNIDATKLSTATSDFVAYLGTISGTGSKVIIDGVEYSIDSTKVQSAISEFQTTLDNMGEIEERLEGDGSEYFTLAPTALSFRATAPLDTLQEIQINGQTVDPANYTLTEGSTIVTFPIDYLKTLESGNYEVGVVSEGQSARGEFAVVAPELNEYSFYYNQPYGAYVEMLGSYMAFFLRENGTVDMIDMNVELPETCTYSIDSNNITIYTPIGNFTGIISNEGLYCNEVATMFVLGNHLIVADEDYLYRYFEEQGGYVATAINKTKVSYKPIQTGINGYDTVALDDYACEYNPNLIRAPYIPNSVKNIGKMAFRGCSALRSVTIPGSVARIDDEAFLHCNSLVDITLFDGIGAIGDTTFCGCEKLTTITIPASITNIDSYAFYGCIRLNQIIFKGTIAQWNAITFGDNWHLDVPATYVQCSDGQVAL